MENDADGAALLAVQDALQAEALAILADLDLLPTLQVMGRPTVTGSLALGLMVGRDIDVTTLCPALNPAGLFRSIAAFAAHPRVCRLAFRNDTGRWNTDSRYPDGLYWTIRYRTDAGDDWNLDLWFLLDGTTQFDLEHLRTLPPRLTPDARLAILRIKRAWHARAEYGSTMRSCDIYEAVLDHGVATPEEFEAYLGRRGPAGSLG